MEPSEPNDNEYCSGDNFIRNYIGPINRIRYNLLSRLHTPLFVRSSYGKYIINIIEYLCARD